MWGHLERTRVKEDVDACILGTKCMLDGQCAEIWHLNGTAIRSHWNAWAGLSQPGKFQGAPAGQSCVAASAAGTVPGGSAGRLTNQG